MSDIIVVKLNGKKYDTRIDEHGVQRYVGNPIVKGMVDSNIKLYNKLGYLEFEKLGVYGLNEIAMDYRVGTSGISLENMLDFYTNMGYSVSGMMDISFFEKVKVKNPLWDN